MNYENRQVPEGINVSRDHPLKEFFALLIGLLLILLVVIAGLSLIAERLVRFIPFETERRLAASVAERYLSTPSDEDALLVESYLRKLGAQLAAHQKLPEGISVTIHYQPGEVVNAFATLGGHVVIYGGLLRKMPSENALAMVLAHEIAHIKHRDPITATGRGLTVSVFLASIGGFSNSSALASLLNNMGLVTAMSFSREQERAADRDALQAVYAHYGHTHGAADLFDVLGSSGREPPAFLNTHPMSRDRKDAVRRFQAEKSTEGETVPIPAAVRAAIGSSSSSR